MPCCCCVKGCKYIKEIGDGVKFHRFPLKNERLCIQWLKRAGFSSEDIRTCSINRCRNLRICGWHFEGDRGHDTDILPTINIPGFSQMTAVSSLLQLSVSPPPQATFLTPQLGEASAVIPGTSQSQGSSHEDHSVSDFTQSEADSSLLQLSASPPPQATFSTPQLGGTSAVLPETSQNQGSTNIVRNRSHSVTETVLSELKSPSRSTSVDVKVQVDQTISTWTSTPTEHATSPPPTRKVLKRKLFVTSSSQVTPKQKRLKCTGVQRTPPIEKSTQVTPINKKTVKSNTNMQFTTSSQTDLPLSISVKRCEKGSQTDKTKTSDQYVQASVPKMEQIKSSDKELKKFTGVEDYKLFQILHKYLVSSCSKIKCNITSHCADPSKFFPHISTEDQVLLVLYKLKINPIDSVLSSEFKISTGRVSEIFKFWIFRMYRKFKIIKIWPSSEKLEMHTPLPTKQNFPDLAAISDCVEFSTQVPRGPVAGKQLFSHYKNCHTVKAMYTTAPNGALIHCSDVYGGSASDKEIFGQSDLANRLKPGQGLMVDKGFLIKDLIQGKEIKLYRPPFLSEKSKQFDSENRDSGRLIARSRITVENFNARLSTFAFLKQKKIPVVTIPYINEIGFVCGFLANLGPLIRQPKVIETQVQQIEEETFGLDESVDLNSEPENL